VIHMLWWRVEFTGEGGIKSCDQVEAVQKNKGLVCYIQATTKAQACQDAKTWVNGYRERKREDSRRRMARAVAAGKCAQCKTRPSRPNKKTCQFCIDRTMRAQRERAEGRPKIETKLPDHVIFERRFDKRLREQANGHYCQLRAHIVLQQFDALSPEAFRAWLVEKIEASKVISPEGAPSARTASPG
jgi:hypothetical protein